MARLVFWMPQERDPSGRFVKTPSDGAESGPEPEAEPEGPGSLAQLLAAFGEQLRGLEERQNAARDGDRAALECRYTGDGGDGAVVGV